MMRFLEHKEDKIVEKDSITDTEQLADALKTLIGFHKEAHQRALGSRLEKEEYGGIVSVSIIECRILGKDAYILRTDSDTGKHGHSPEQILEIATDTKLRDEFGLKDGEIVAVEVNAGAITKI